MMNLDQKEFHDHCKALALFLLRWCGAHIRLTYLMLYPMSII